MSNQIYIAVGAPGSGKSTWWENGIQNGIIPQEGETIRINMDEIRKKITGNESDQSQNTKVAKFAQESLKNALSLKVPTIYWDNTTARPRYRKEIIRPAKAAGYECICLYFKLPVEIVLERNLTRERFVPEDIVRRMWNSIKKNPPSLEEGFDNIITIYE